MDELGAKTVVVTGAASGIGRAMATAFAAAGSNVVASDVEEPPLHEVVAEIERAGADAVAVVADVADADAVARLRDAAIDAFGGVHVLCNNAGVGGGGPIAEVSLKTWEWVLGVNLWGVIHGLHAFLPGMIEQGQGHVVNTASVAGHLSPSSMGPYNASKHAVVSISESLQQEMVQAGHDIGVTCLCPGFVATNIIRSERNRPEHLLDADGAGGFSGDDETAAMIADAYAAQMPPERVAEQVVEAVRTNQLYLFTDRVFDADIAERHRRIQERVTPGVVTHLADRLFT